ncbi:MAG TPA: TadE/TadG family type IV pilus assembly protein [Acidimicrobiia bacterium]
MRNLTSLRREERGATLVEFALIFTLLLMLALGAYEYGVALRDWQSVTIATREGARVAASAANYQEADCAILEATAGALQSFRKGNINFVTIYKSDENGTFPGAGPLAAVYKPKGTGDVALPNCPDWTYVSGGENWEFDERLNSSGDPFWIGVRLDYSHSWQTNFLWWSGTVSWQDDAVFRIEPPPPNI